MNQDYSIPFRLAYLLGVKENKIKATFPNEYNESQSLKLFENYKDAKKLRMLCIFRNSVISDYARYRRKFYKTLEGFQFITNKETSFLHNNDIKINKLFYDLDFVDYFNMLSELINTLAYKVLLDMEFPYIEEISTYFNFPVLKEKEIENYVSLVPSIENPMGVFIYDCEKIKTTLKYSFNNNKTCIMSAFSIMGKSVLSIDPVLSFEFRTSMGVDLDESVSNKLQEVVEFYSSAKERREKLIKQEKERIEKEKEAARLAEEERIAEEKRLAEEKRIAEENKLAEEKRLAEEKKFANEKKLLEENGTKSKISSDNFNSLNKPIKDKIDINIVKNVSENTLIVDCKNIDFFTFVCFMHKTEVFSKIVLINDFETNSIWNLVSDVLSNKINIEKISVTKNNYFVTNMNTLLIHNICKNVYQLNNSAVGVVSNSTEYFDLFEVINDVNFSIYTTKIDDLPLSYLQSKSINVEDISESIDKFTTEWIMNDVVNYAILYYILNRPLYTYNEKEMIISICENLNFAISLDSIKTIFYSMKEKIKIDILGGTAKIYNDKYCVSVNN